MGSPSAWTARVPGASTSSSSGSGDRSSTRRSTSELTTRSPRPAPRSAGISASTIPADRIGALTGGRRIKPTSLGCRRSRRPEPGRHSTYQAGKPVQTNRASSDLAPQFARLLPWLMLNRDPLDVFVHPETGDDLADHRDHAMWLGE